ncbi:M28 family metallopeptidase [Sphingomonas sp. Leaf33]|uniref:M28 family metallopeptidase n=1 Tax=Sphingomonas sp. Leaf33 TaxID=1736215 RepID=UPI0009EBD083|nr:M28 family metallopeptidase [Sphingomonas sp. Leaf33]
MAKSRFATAASLSLVLAVPAVAQTAPAPAAATPAPAAAPAVNVAERNAITNAALSPAEAAMKAHVMFLASDAMKGRDAGSPEYDIAAQYVASQFYAAGLRPMGDEGSYLQKVPLITVKAKDQGSFTYQPAKGAAVPMTFGKDYVPGANPSNPATKVDAGLAFVGFGIVEPGSKRDDYAGVDVKGKIVLLFGGAPESLHPELRAHFGSAATKRAIAMAKGAVGVLTIEPTMGMINMAAAGYQRPRVTWEKGGIGFDPAPGAPGLGLISQSFAQTLFAGSKLAWADVVKGAASAETRFKATALPGRLSAAINTEWTPLPSSNVVGLLPGSDAKLKDEFVVLSAHLDHVGVGRAVNGDTIYNGAEDNAVGIASLIEEAKKFKASGTAPKRSILFLAVTAEEKGLVGAEYFANNPTVPKAAMVADVNLDMPIITYKFEDVIAFGADRSTLGPIVRKAAASIGVGFSPDPMPEQGLFTRSDHYRFVQQGVPSVFLWPGQAGPGKAAVDDFFKNHYHKPSDEVWQMPALDWSQGVRFVDVNYAIAREIADGAERPKWNKGDFFGLLYGGYGAK